MELLDKGVPFDRSCGCGDGGCPPDPQIQPHKKDLTKRSAAKPSGRRNDFVT